MVASHYLEAYRAEPGAADAEEIADRARTWLMRAGDRASSLGSPEQAYAYAVQALPLATNPADRAALHDRAARSASSAGDTEACGRTCSQPRLSTESWAIAVPRPGC